MILEVTDFVINSFSSVKIYNPKLFLTFYLWDLDLTFSEILPKLKKQWTQSLSSESALGLQVVAGLGMWKFPWTVYDWAPGNKTTANQVHSTNAKCD
jgi:hypothetical protein